MSGMQDVLISPAEREPITKLGRVSSLPEQMGSDVLWSVPGGLAGLQRKAILDLVASTRDGRLGRELMQMQSLKAGFLCIEGTPAWEPDGTLIAQHVVWNRKMQWGVELSIMQHGIMILRTRSALETCALVEYLYERTQQEDHLSSLLQRTGPSKNGWGRLSDRATAVHVLTGLPQVGLETAQRLYDHFGRCILGLNVSEEELQQVAGIGKKKAAAIVKACS